MGAGAVRARYRADMQLLILTLCLGPTTGKREEEGRQKFLQTILFNDRKGRRRILDNI